MRFLPSTPLAFALALALAAASGCKKDDDDTDTAVTDTDTDVTDTDTDTVDTDTVDTDTDVPDTDTDTDVPDTDTDPSAWNLTLTGVDFDPHDGDTVAMAVHDMAGFTFVGLDFATVAGGTFTLDLTGMLADGGSYSVDYFADMNGNKKCDNEDHAWHLEIGPVTGDVVLNEIHDPATVDLSACKAF